MKIRITVEYEFEGLSLKDEVADWLDGAIEIRDVVAAGETVKFVLWDDSELVTDTRFGDGGRVVNTIYVTEEFVQ